MNGRDLMEGMNGVDQRYVVESEEKMVLVGKAKRGEKNRRFAAYLSWGVGVAAAVMILILNGIRFWNDNEQPQKVPVTMAQTEKETVEETEHTEKEAPDYANADVLVMKKRVISFKDLLNAYYGEGNWSVDNLSVGDMDTGFYKNPDNGEEIILSASSSGYFWMEIFFSEADETEEILEIGKTIFRNMGLEVSADYFVMTNYIEFPHYVFYREIEGIKVCPFDIWGSTPGSEIAYTGCRLSVIPKDDCYEIAGWGISDIVRRQTLDNPRKLLSDEMIQEAVYSHRGRSDIEEHGPIEDAVRIQPMYMMVDKGANADETVFDIGFYYNQKLEYRIVEDTPMCLRGFVDGQLPFCFMSAIEGDYEVLGGQEEIDEIETEENTEG